MRDQETTKEGVLKENLILVHNEADTGQVCEKMLEDHCGVAADSPGYAHLASLHQAKTRPC